MTDHSMPEPYTSVHQSVSRHGFALVNKALTLAEFPGHRYFVPIVPNMARDPYSAMPMSTTEDNWLTMHSSLTSNIVEDYTKTDRATAETVFWETVRDSLRFTNMVLVRSWNTRGYGPTLTVDPVVGVDSLPEAQALALAFDQHNFYDACSNTLIITSKEQPK